jgi:uncharacterized protein (DUF2236 family)
MARNAPHAEALCGHESVSWRLRQEAGVILPLGGARASLLQLAHPKIAAGIAEHSYVEADPYERVRRTGEAMGAIRYGSASERRAVLARLDSIHREVRGTLPTGEPYVATDPALMFFVLATLIDSNLVVEERYVGLLTDAERRQYYLESVQVADAFGIPRSRVPEDLKAFRAYMQKQLSNLEVGEVARRVGGLVLHPTFVRLPRPALAAYRLIICDLLPPEIRRAYELPEHSRLRPFGRVFRAGSRTLFPRLPLRLRSTVSVRPRAA